MTMVSRRVTDAHTTQVENDWWGPALLIMRRKNKKLGRKDSMSGQIRTWVIGYVRRNAQDWLTEQERAQLPGGRALASKAS